MKMYQYVKQHTSWIACIVAVLLVINGILFTSTTIQKSYIDIVYMDVVCIIICFVSFLYGFFQKKKKYDVVFLSSIEELERNKYKQDYVVTMLAKKLKEQQRTFWIVEEKYKNSSNEMQDYTTQWVHDIKVNLAVCDLLLEELDEESSREFHHQMEQIKFRVNHILHVTRANHYDQDLAATEVDISYVLRRVIRENARFFIHKNINIETELHAFYVMSDERWVYYIFEQILNNSSKYTPNGGTVTITMEENEQAYVIRIRDNGIGIPTEDVARIFMKGFTGQNGKIGTKSTGMGLYYAKKMAENLSINIQVDSKEGQYTVFTVVFYKLSDYYKRSMEIGAHNGT